MLILITSHTQVIQILEILILIHNNCVDIIEKQETIIVWLQPRSLPW